ncbi:endonuclease/exonuclease/phosphatase family protein [Salinispira pacifica]|uniref:Endonuclease/exonuclease/phosphatase domain-containing protein n=1 Tax=Salinispira pacifica TaxID=1307761 RepID=V5WM60_9SPIO|nr:hypothetical protein [Salinispira pacifica]AHC16191.1 hypothetical protein L21SP2_2843 [Salinispira pacifica]
MLSKRRSTRFFASVLKHPNVVIDSAGRNDPDPGTYPGTGPLLLVCALLCFVSCQVQQPEADHLRILSYNVQTLFNDVNDGGEFPEFIPHPQDWNSKKYHNRLRRLSRVLRDMVPGGPDIIILQEIENASVLSDLNSLYLRDLGYRSGFSASSESASPLSLGVLTRLKVLNRKVHGVQVGAESRRPVLELSLELPGGGTLIVFAFHWKSKLGDRGGESAELRRAESRQLASLLSTRRREFPHAAMLVAGDANEDIHEGFLNPVSGDPYSGALLPVDVFSGAEPLPHGIVAVDMQFPDLRQFPGTPLMLAGAGSLDDPLLKKYLLESGDPPVMYHFWGKPRAQLEETGTEVAGSYAYSGRWERIDQLAVNETLLENCGYSRCEFQVGNLWYLLDGDGEPAAYRSHNGYGYSDHLPLLLVLRE